MSAAGDEQAGAVRDTELAQQPPHIENPAFFEFRRVKFQIADDANGIRLATQLAQALGIIFILAADTGQRSEQRAKQKTKPAIATVRPGRQAGINEKDRYM